MSLKIFYTVNAGLYFYNRKQGLLIDGLHRDDGGFSITPGAMAKDLLSHSGIFSNEIDLAFTHLHGDHFDPVQVRCFYDHNPKVKIYGPNLFVGDFSAMNIAGGIEQMCFGEFLLTAFTTVHDGAIFANQPHRSFCLQADGRQYIICGDAILEPTLAKQVSEFCSKETDAVFINVYQLASKSGLDFLRELTPQRVFLYHLPDPHEDPYGYWKMARNIISQQTHLYEPYIQILNPLSHISIQ